MAEYTHPPIVDYPVPDKVMRRTGVFWLVCTRSFDRWCRFCGTCKCVKINKQGAREWDNQIGYPDCPLHGPNSAHARRRLIQRRTADV